MKVRLMGIMLEPDADCPSADGDERTTNDKERMIARLSSPIGETYSYLTFPAEAVRGAEIGDEFTVYLERVKK